MKQQGKLPVHNTVHLLVGEDTIEVSLKLLLFLFITVHKVLALIIFKIGQIEN